ncbi:MAG: hypothetical protein ACHQ17_05430 [Polyangia bacterium]
MIRNLNRMLAVITAALVLVFALPAHAEIQKSGSEVFPGKFAVGFHPIGVQAAFDSTSTSGYKLSMDFAGVVANLSKLTVWVGGAFSYTYPAFGCGNGNVIVNGNVITAGGFGGCAHDVELGVFVRLTFEKLIHIPLVPYVQAGLAGDFLVFGGNTSLGGAFAFPRFGGGVEYYLTKNIGLGVQTDFALGPGSYPGCGNNGSNCVGFWGNWDFLMGARFAF